MSSSSSPVNPSESSGTVAVVDQSAALTKPDSNDPDSAKIETIVTVNPDGSKTIVKRRTVEKKVLVTKNRQQRIRKRIITNPDGTQKVEETVEEVVGEENEETKCPGFDTNQKQLEEEMLKDLKVAGGDGEVVSQSKQLTQQHIVQDSVMKSSSSIVSKDPAGGAAAITTGNFASLSAATPGNNNDVVPFGSAGNALSLGGLGGGGAAGGGPFGSLNITAGVRQTGLDGQQNSMIFQAGNNGPMSAICGGGGQAMIMPSSTSSNADMNALQPFQSTGAGQLVAPSGDGKSLVQTKFFGQSKKTVKNLKIVNGKEVENVANESFLQVAGENVGDDKTKIPDYGSMFRQLNHNFDNMLYRKNGFFDNFTTQFSMEDHINFATHAFANIPRGLEDSPESGAVASPHGALTIGPGESSTFPALPAPPSPSSPSPTPGSKPQKESKNKKESKKDGQKSGSVAESSISNTATSSQSKPAEEDITKYKIFYWENFASEEIRKNLSQQEIQYHNAIYELFTSECSFFYLLKCVLDLSFKHRIFTESLIDETQKKLVFGILTEIHQLIGQNLERCVEIWEKTKPNVDGLRDCFIEFLASTEIRKKYEEFFLNNVERSELINGTDCFKELSEEMYKMMRPITLYNLNHSIMKRITGSSMPLELAIKNGQRAMQAGSCKLITRESFDRTNYLLQLVKFLNQVVSYSMAVNESNRRKFELIKSLDWSNLTGAAAAIPSELIDSISNKIFDAEADFKVIKWQSGSGEVFEHDIDNISWPKKKLHWSKMAKKKVKIYHFILFNDLLIITKKFSNGFHDSNRSVWSLFRSLQSKGKMSVEDVCYRSDLIVKKFSEFSANPAQDAIRPEFFVCSKSANLAHSANGSSTAAAASSSASSGGVLLGGNHLRVPMLLAPTNSTDLNDITKWCNMIHKPLTSPVQPDNFSASSSHSSAHFSPLNKTSSTAAVVKQPEQAAVGPNNFASTSRMNKIIPPSAS